jgi:hypothetical protein
MVTATLTSAVRAAATMAKVTPLKSLWLHNASDGSCEYTKESEIESESRK